MAKREIERTVQGSVIDRLTDDEPHLSADPRTTYVESLKRFKATVQRDLVWLLNTHRIPEPAPDEFPELQHSLYHYGVPDVTSMSAESMADRERLLLQMEDALALFEPRFENVKISMVELEGESRRRELRFIVEATLRLDPTPEQVMFDTVLHFTTGQVDVTGEAKDA
jgi:type VI secretion system protein ImpF